MPPLLLGVHGNAQDKAGWRQTLATTPCVTRLAVKNAPLIWGLNAKYSDYEPRYTLCVEHLRTKCRPQSARGIGDRDSREIARVQFLHWFTE